MNARKTVLLALFGLTLATPVLAQSGTAVQNKRQTAPDPLALLRPRWSHNRTSLGSKSPAPDAVALGLATAKVYRFSSADYPGANSSVVFDMNTTTAVADFQFSSASPQTGFTLHGGAYQTFSVPGSSSGSLLTGINTSGAMVGVYTDTSNLTHGVLDVAGVFTNIDEPTGTTTPYDINDNGEIVGLYIDTSGVSHGFSTTDNGVHFSNFDFPGATATIAAGVNTAGVITGQWTDSTSHFHGFVVNGGVFTSFDFPLAVDTTAVGINDSNEVGGYYTDATTTHGFIYSNGAFARVDVAGAAGSEVSRIKNKGQITGGYFDATKELHGMIGR
jgi:hypothetical protein